MEGSLCCVFISFGSLSVLCQAKPKEISLYLQNKQNLRLTCASFILLQSVNGSYIFTPNILAKSAPQHTTHNTVLFLQSISLGVSKTWLKNAKASCKWKLNYKTSWLYHKRKVPVCQDNFINIKNTLRKGKSILLSFL